MFFEKVNEKGKGELVVKWLGGKEVIAATDQPEAVMRGVVEGNRNLLMRTCLILS